MLAEFLQFFLQPFDTITDETTIHLKLRLARATTHADTAALALEVRPAANQSRHQVLHLRQLNLPLTLGAACALGKNIQNQIGAINHPYVDEFFNVANLDRRKLMIEHHQIGIVLGHARGQFFDLSATGKGSCVGFGALGANGRSNRCTGAGDELDCLTQAVVK